jgi:hypothetical protein
MMVQCCRMSSCLPETKGDANSDPIPATSPG